MLWFALVDVFVLLAFVSLLMAMAEVVEVGVRSPPEPPPDCAVVVVVIELETKKSVSKNLLID